MLLQLQRKLGLKNMVVEACIEQGLLRDNLLKEKVRRSKKTQKFFRIDFFP